MSCEDVFVMLSGVPCVCDGFITLMTPLKRVNGRTTITPCLHNGGFITAREAYNDGVMKLVMCLIMQR